MHLGRLVTHHRNPRPLREPIDPLHLFQGLIGEKQANGFVEQFKEYNSSIVQTMENAAKADAILLAAIRSCDMTQGLCRSVFGVGCPRYNRVKMRVQKKKTGGHHGVNLVTTPMVDDLRHFYHNYLLTEDGFPAGGRRMKLYVIEPGVTTFAHLYHHYLSYKSKCKDVDEVRK